MELLGVVWFLVSLVLEILIDHGGWEPFPIREGKASGVLFEAFAWLVVGALLGLFSGIVLPDRLLPRPRTPGLSLVMSPLACGVAMHVWGGLRRERGQAPSSLATFHGAASFALGAALGRFVLVA